MKVFFPVEVYYPSQAGGAANSVYFLVRALRREGFSTSVAASDRGIAAETPRDVWQESVDDGRVAYFTTRLRLLPLRLILVSLRETARADVVHLSSVFFPGAIASAIAARFLGKPLVVSPRGELDPAALVHSPLRKRLALAIYRALVGAAYPLYHATSAAEANCVRRVFGASASVATIPNYIEVPESAPRQAGGRYLLFLGRIHPIKGLDNLIRAVARSKMFRTTGMPLRIAGTGDPDYVAELRRLAAELSAADLIQFAGQVEGRAKDSLLAGADWTVLPSHSENFGNVVAESLAQSTPVIASKGTPWASLEDSGVGRWVDNSPESLAAAIDAALELPEAEYDEIRRRCRPFVTERLDAFRNGAQWTRLYRRPESFSSRDEISS